ncbi:MAG: NAD(P)H:quinone oxidoreductase type IV [Thermodesulfobacteriota bacterium]|nr:MAG: NAD(P)H:quinone oxidoreductase type IV [Thermodesulfobacteriota bacterium]
MKIHIIFYSLYGHVFQMAEAMAEGANSIDGGKVQLFQVPETLPDEVIEKMHATEAKKAFSHIPVAKVADLAEADGIIFGTPTRFGNMCAQMRTFLDATGQLWMQGALVGKVGSVFASTATQHGGQESTILSFHTTLLHHGMIIVGMPYTEKRQMTLEEITGGTPYGATTIAAPDGSRQPSKNELGMARFQGMHVAKIVKKLSVEPSK